MENCIQALMLGLSLLLSVSTAHAEDCGTAARLLDDAGQYTNNLALAEAKVQEAVSVCQRSASLHYDLGRVYYLESKYVEAENEFQEALRLNPRYPKAMSSLALVLYKHRDQDYAHALDLASKAAFIDSNTYNLDILSLIQASVDHPVSRKRSNNNAVAVVIGNRNYIAPDVHAVEFAIRDAQAMKRYLIQSFGFKENNIIARDDAKMTDLLTIFGDGDDYKGSLYKFIKQGKSDVFIFYSGHGAPDTNTKKAYLAPVDVNPNAVKYTSYSLEQLYKNLSKISRDKQTKSITVVIDACFSGGSHNGPIIKNASPISIEVKEPILGLKNGVVITSSQRDQVSSWYSDQRHGLFTYYFLKAIKDTLEKGKTLTVAAIKQRLLGVDGVNDAAIRLFDREQTPHFVGNLDILLASE